MEQKQVDDLIDDCTHAVLELTKKAGVEIDTDELNNAITRIVDEAVKNG